MKRVVLALTVCCAHFAFGGVFTWSGGGEAGNWSDSDNWQSEAGGCPGAGDTALFNSTVEITSALEIAAGTLTVTNNAGTELHFKGVISGEGGIFKGGGGSLHLHNTNTFRGGGSFVRRGRFWREYERDAFELRICLRRRCAWNRSRAVRSGERDRNEKRTWRASLRFGGAAENGNSFQSRDSYRQ